MDKQLTPVFARQYGLVTHDQVMGAGGNKRIIQNRMATGRWIRVGSGVYRLAGVQVTWRQKALSRSRPAAARGTRWRPSTKSQALEGASVDRVPVTRPARTVRDLARTVRGDLLEAGLGHPVRQYFIEAADARVDLAYPDEWIAIELDSFRWHAGRRPFASDRSRGNRIVAAGWQLLRAAPGDLTPLVTAARTVVRRVA